MGFSRFAAFILAALISRNVEAASSASIRVDLDKPGHAISPTLYGIFFEEINRAGDGGLYAEMLQNRSFEDSSLTAQSWGGDAERSLDKSKPLNEKNPTSLNLSFHKAGESLVNSGFIRSGGKETGCCVQTKDRPDFAGGLSLSKGAALRFSAYQRGDAALEVRLEGKNGKVLARADMPPPAADWKRIELTLSPDAADPNARLVLASKGPGTLWLDQLSLVPAETWKGHGLRKDLAEMVAALKPGFVRFPGGCFVEGDKRENSTRWKDSIGDPATRKGVANLWGYQTTGGFGAYEFFQWCEDMGAEPLYVINCGMSHGPVVPLKEMKEYVQDAVDLVEYARGPADSRWGARRAAAGHPAPFKLNYMEIGNENGGPDYEARYALFHDALKKKYPDLHLITNVWGGVPKNRPLEFRDEHYYTDPQSMQAMAEHYDKYDRKEPKVYVGEYAVTKGCGLGNLVAAVSEAAFMTGLEANSDVVLMSSYAPLFVHPSWKAWDPNAIVFDQSRVYGTPSYHVQAMFASNLGATLLPISIVQTEEPFVASRGFFGVGTWGTQAEYKDISFKSADGKVTFASDFSRGTQGWKFVRGDWQVRDGALRQTGLGEHAVAVIEGSAWTDGVYSMKARKQGGREGFQIQFQAEDEDQHRIWNLGGWNNTMHGLQTVLGEPQIEGKIETDRWYDIRLELSGPKISCYLDGRLAQELVRAQPKAVYGVASKSADGKELILKLVNTKAVPFTGRFDLRGSVKAGAKGKAIVMGGSDAMAENSFTQPRRVAPVESSFSVPGNAFSRELPAMSVSILRIPLGGRKIAQGKFKPTWDSLVKNYKSPEWFRDAKFGIWAHWSAQCQPEDGDWYARQMYIQGSDQYKDHLKRYGHPSEFGFKDIDNAWHAEHWEPEKLMDLYKAAGAKYFVSLANHHDNFDNYDSTYQEWNSTKVGPHKDIVGTWEKTARAHGLRFGVSNHSAHTWHWFQTAYGYDPEGPKAGVRYDGWLTKAEGKGKWWEGLDPQELYGGVNMAPPDGIKTIKEMDAWHEKHDREWNENPPLQNQHFVDKWFLRAQELLDKYRPDLIYFDNMDLPLGQAGLDITAHFYNSNMALHGGKLEAVVNAKSLKKEYRAAVTEDYERGAAGGILPDPWQTDTCIGSWHYDKGVFERHGYKTVAEVVHKLVEVVSKNGNLLLSVPLKGDGTLDGDELKFLKGMAAWMDVNGEGIFGTRPWLVFGEGPTRVASGMFNEGNTVFTPRDIRFTTKKGALYATVLALPDKGQIRVRSLAKPASERANVIQSVSLLGYPEKLTWEQDADGLLVGLPSRLPSEHSLTLKIAGKNFKPQPIVESRPVVTPDAQRGADAASV